MTDSYGSRARREYLRPYKDGHFCYGSKRTCQDYKGTAQIIEWGTEPGEDVLREIRYLRLLPSVSLLKKPEMPAFVGMLSRLSFLEVPLPLIPCLGPESIPPSLMTLMVTNIREYERILAKKETLWPEGLEPPGLRAFFFHTNSMNKGAIWPNLRIGEGLVSKIEYLKTHLDPQGSICSEIERFSSLAFLEADHIRSNPLVSHIRSNLKVLYMTGCDNESDLSDLPRIPSLEIVILNGFGPVIDCAVFLDLPNLIELTIRNSKRFANIHRLKDLPKLKSLELVNCGNPLSDSEKADLADLGLEILNVKFS